MARKPKAKPAPTPEPEPERVELVERPIAGQPVEMPEDVAAEMHRLRLENAAYRSGRVAPKANPRAAMGSSPLGPMGPPQVMKQPRRR